MAFTSTHRFARISARKARLVADLIRGKSVDQALTALTFSKKRAAVLISKALKSAVANADQAEADVRSLVVTEAKVDEGPTMKRFQPKDRGRAHPIMKRTSHISVAVAEGKPKKR
jgi:large subunit ribosomal protein L22